MAIRSILIVIDGELVGALPCHEDVGSLSVSVLSSNPRGSSDGDIIVDREVVVTSGTQPPTVFDAANEGSRADANDLVARPKLHMETST